VVIHVIFNDMIQDQFHRIDDVDEQVDLICQACETYPAPFHHGCPYILSNDQIICPRVKLCIPQLPTVVTNDGSDFDDETDNFDPL
jgi:hypothetical protein